MAYFAGVVFSTMLHMLVVSALWINWYQPTEKVFIQPKYINAELVKLAPIEQKRSSETANKPDYRPIKQTDKNQVTRSKEDEGKKATKRKELEAEKEKLEVDRKRLKREREAQLRRAREAEWEETLAEAEAQQLAEEDERAANSFRQVIQRRLSENWSRPPSARRGMETHIRIALVPTGRVVGLTIIESSGDIAFDRSVEQAVRKVGQFVELQTMDSRLFELKFRSVDVAFSPEDLRL
ncbi:MAG: TonB family protein [Cellvibrionales bacterium TMED148]|nr:MAG: TonB family protein [Cellvibrionales bacterium TMED148]